MKFNWGTGIALFYGTFVLIMVFAVIRSTKQDNSLVSDQYYADDLKYQEHYDKLVNAQSLERDLAVKNNPSLGQVELRFPSALGQVSGEVHFFCPRIASRILECL
ncbi:MAG: FixH family protein [Haliscomenobacter sp.]|nr:FixH family protein [Haliscomenobacter sp.]